MKIFISYRRKDLGGYAHLLVDRISEDLVEEFGAHNVFQDKSSISGGEDFTKEIKDAISQTRAMLVIIGPDWMNLFKLSNTETDYVVLEIEEALSRKVPIIPVLIDDTAIPKSEDLAKQIQALFKLDIVRIDAKENFTFGVSKLISAIKKLSIPEYFDFEKYRAIIHVSPNENINKIFIQKKLKNLSYREVLDLWTNDKIFKDFFIRLLKINKMPSYFWETPPLTNTTIDRDFECIMKSKPKNENPPTPNKYADEYVKDKDQDGIVFCKGMEGEEELIIPIPIDSKSDYRSLKLFTENAPLKLQHALWEQVGKNAQQKLSNKPIWISVAGSGVNWLHIRFDRTPSYYQFSEYVPLPAKMN